MVIPAMDHIDQVFVTYALDTMYSPPIRAGLELAKKTLNCYYNRTNESHLYCIAMGKSTHTSDTDSVSHENSSSPS